MKQVLDPRQKLDPRGLKLNRDWEQDVDYPHDRLVVGSVQLTANMSGVNIYTVQFPAGTVPETEVDAEPVVRRCWALFGTAESGDANNYTSIEFRAGTLSTYDTLGSVTTFNNGVAYAAGGVLELRTWWPVGDKEGQLLFAVATRVNAGTDYNQKIYHFGVEVIFVRR